eukprot:15352487-Ditylum_brightwellii.AAC.1
MILDKLDDMGNGEKADINKDVNKIFENAITWGNYFSEDTIFDYTGKKGYNLLTPMRHDMLPKGVTAQHLYKKATNPGNQAAKCSYFNEAIVMVQNKEDPETKNKHQKEHVSFQSIFSYNIQAVNMLSSVSKFEETKGRGIGKNKHKWVIEMNDLRQPCLKTYYDIGSIDHILKNCRMGYCTYWHSPINHNKALDAAITYGMYLEVTEGNIYPLCKITNPTTFWQFRECLSKQMCAYNAMGRLYADEENMRVCAQQHIAR